MTTVFIMKALLIFLKSHQVRTVPCKTDFKLEFKYT